MAKRWFIVDKEFDKDKIVAYTIMDEDGKASYVRADALREKMMKGFRVENLTLTKNGRLLPTSPKHPYFLSQDAHLLKVITYDTIFGFPSIDVGYKLVERVGQGEGVICGLTIRIRVHQSSYTIYGEKVRFKTGVKGYWLGICYCIPELNDFFREYANTFDHDRRYHTYSVLNDVIKVVQ